MESLGPSWKYTAAASLRGQAFGCGCLGAGQFFNEREVSMIRAGTFRPLRSHDRLCRYETSRGVLHLPVS